MPKFALPIAIVAVLTSGLCAAVIPDSPSDDLSSKGNAINEIPFSLSNSEFNRHIINHPIDNGSQNNVKDFHTESAANRLRRSAGRLEDYIKCTKIDDSYVQYNNVSLSCVDAYTDAGCTIKKYLRPGSGYTVESFLFANRTVDVCDDNKIPTKPTKKRLKRIRSRSGNFRTNRS